MGEDGYGNVNNTPSMKEAADLPPCTIRVYLGLVYFTPKTKKFSRFLSLRIFRHMHEALNIDENKN